MKTLSLGFSPCPNDTFIFYALVHNRIDSAGLQFAPPHLEDVETLNGWALEKRLDVTKISCHALGHVLAEYCVLSAGSALGRGCGPLLVAASEMPLEDLAGKKVAIPGRLTTAALLFRLMLPSCGELIEMRFDRIAEAVLSRQVDAGVIIHESRFTYAGQGLVCLQDLGQWWEDVSGQPIPLGCIVARRSLGRDMLGRIDRAIAASVDYAFAAPADCLPYIRDHSQETAVEVVQNHIGLYVNDYSRDLGPEGMASIRTFLERGRQCGILPQEGRAGLPVFTSLL